MERAILKLNAGGLVAFGDEAHLDFRLQIR
jgi:hypothetical protein